MKKTSFKQHGHFLHLTFKFPDIVPQIDKNKYVTEIQRLVITDLLRNTECSLHCSDVTDEIFSITQIKSMRCYYFLDIYLGLIVTDINIEYFSKTVKLKFSEVAIKL